MANFTKDGNQPSTQEYLCTIGLGVHQKIFLITTTIPIAIVTFLGNVLIILALKKVTSLRPPSKVLLGCLAATDVGVGLVTSPLRMGYIMSPEHSKRCHYFKHLYETIGAIFCAVSVFILTAISVDRLLALVLGLKYKQVVALRRVWFLVVTIWILSTCLAFLEVYNFRIVINVAYIVPLLCIATSTFCYMKIYLTLRHHQSQVQGHVQQRQQDEGVIPLYIARYRKTVSNALWIQMTLLACYVPYTIVTATVAITRSNSKALGLLWSVIISLLLINSLLNPFLYCWKMREVRQGVKDTIRRLGWLSS